METVTFTLSWTFSKESVINFAISKWWTEKVLAETEIENELWLNIVQIEKDNPISFEMFVKDYFIDVVSNEISELQKNQAIKKIILDAEEAKKETEKTIKDNIKQGLTISVE